MGNPFVLVVEDDPELSEIFAFALEAEDFRTEVVRDGGLALERMRATSPDIVMLDMHLPNMSGTEILTRMRADPLLAATKVVIVTADALIARQNEDMVDMVLLKPVSFDQVSRLPKRLLSKEA